MAFWKLNPIAIWLAILYHLWFGFLIGGGLFYLGREYDFFKFVYDLPKLDAVSLFFGLIVIAVTLCFFLIPIVNLSLYLPLAKWTVHKNLRMLDQIFGVGGKS